MAAVFIARGHAIEEKGVNVVVERFVIEEELAKETEIAAPPALTTAINLEKGNEIIPIDFITWRMK